MAREILSTMDMACNGHGLTVMLSCSPDITFPAIGNAWWGTSGKWHLIRTILARLGNIGADGDVIHLCADFLVGFEGFSKWIWKL